MHRAIPIYCLAAGLTLTIRGFAQAPLHGRIERQRSSEVLQGVSVYNQTRDRTNRSDAGGNYRIEAHPGDTVIFTSAGYLPDTSFVAGWMLEETDGYNIYLKPHLVSLPAVVVEQNSQYLLDSLQRRDDYTWIYAQHQDAVISDTNFTRGFGLSFDLNFYSKHQKEKRELRKRLAQEEEDYYIDFRCPPAYVGRITGLHGDSLRLFLLRYRPGYSFCRKASNEDIFLYINDKVKLFRHPPPSKSPPPKSPPPGPPRHPAHLSP